MNQQHLSKRESSLSQEEIFYLMLKKFFTYPFREEKEKRAFGYLFKRWPQIDLVSVLKKKLDYWRKYPNGLKSKRKNPREQLKEFILREMWDLVKESILRDIEKESGGGNRFL
jgi:spore maturation protein CgeB